MESKFIIFAVFASLVQCSFALPLEVTYGLSEKELATLTRIIIDQEETLAGKFDGFNPIFDVVEKYAAALIYNLKNVSDDDSATIAAALARVKDGIDYIMDAIVVALGTSSPSVDEVRDSVNAKLDAAYAEASSALELAAAGNYSANLAQLNTHRQTAHDELSTLIQSIYDLMRSMVDSSDEEILAEIDLAQTRSATGVDRAGYAVFNAIFPYGAAVTAGKADVALISKIESYRENALDGLRADVESKFSLLKAYYINSQLSSPVDLTNLYANQYSLTVSNYRYQAVVEAYFEPIETYLNGLALGLEDSGRADFSPADALEARALAKVIPAYEVFLDSILVIHPDAENAVANARAALSVSAAAVVTNVFDLIEVARDPAITYSESLQIIETSSETGSSGINSFVDAHFDLIHNGETWDSNSETEFNTLRDAAVDQLQTAFYYVLEAIKTLAKAVGADVATESDFAAVETAKAETVAALDSFTQKISAAGVVELKASSSSAQNLFSKSRFANSFKNIFHSFKYSRTV